MPSVSPCVRAGRPLVLAEAAFGKSSSAPNVLVRSNLRPRWPGTRESRLAWQAGSMERTRSHPQPAHKDDAVAWEIPLVTTVVTNSGATYRADLLVLITGGLTSRRQ